MNIFTRTNRVSARAFAFITAISMILSAFPAHFFVAEAAASGLVTVSLIPDPSTGPESFTVNFSGTGSLDLTGWEVKDSSSFSYVFSGVILTSGDDYRVCQNSAPTTTCDAVWSGSSVWNNSGDTFLLEDENDAEVLSFTYGVADDDEVFTDEANVEQDDPAPQTGTIIVEKLVPPQSDGPTTEFDFSGDLGDFTLLGNATTSFEVKAGEYTVTEELLPGWILASLSCDVDDEVVDKNSVTVSVEAGETVVCEFGNRPEVSSTGTIVIEKLTPEEGENTEFDFTGDLGDFALLGNATTSFAVAAGEYTVTELVPEGWTLASLSCDVDDEVVSDESVTITVEADETITCEFGNRPVLQCEDEMPGWADEAITSDQGNQKNGNPVAAGRSNTDDALGESDWSNGDSDGFYSLGFGGSLTVKFDKYVPDLDGDDISVHEATNGSYPLERAQVEVSQNGTDWFLLTEEATNDKDEGGENVTLLDFSETGLLWIQYVRVTDISDPALHSANADAFDVDAIDAVKELCEEPEPEPEYAKIIAHKLVCEDEADLPNWGKNGPNITESLVEEWMNDDTDSCEPEAGWEFQWGPQNTFDPGDDFYGEAGDPWNTFGPTDETGMTMTLVSEDELEGNKHLWFREVLKEGYINFTHEFASPKNSDDYTAEVYCHKDVKNYDNYDRIDGVEVDETYYCLAWNVEEEKLSCERDVNLLANPSFEEPVVSGAWDIFDLSTYPALAWTVGFVDNFSGAPDEASLELQRNVKSWDASDGEQYAELDSDWQGPGGGSGEEASVEISQIVPTIPGEEYVLRWDFSPRPKTNGAQNQLEVFVDGNKEADNSGAGGDDVNWTSDSYSFVASGNTTEIAFADGGTPNSVGTFLDNVSLTCEAAPQCSIEMVSDTNTVVVEGNIYAVETYVHPNWTADIDDADWIWNSDYVENPEEDETYTFKETFTVAGGMSAVLDVAADNSYRAYLNGVLVIDRSGQGNNFQSHTQVSEDVTSALQDGENTLLIEVTNNGVDDANNRQNPAGVLYKLVVEGEARCEVTTEPDPEDQTHYVDGYKWNDENGNGEKDGEEEYLPDWVIYATNGDDQRSTTTDANGYYWFELPDGEWTISEGDQLGWVQTYPEEPGVCVFLFEDQYELATVRVQQGYSCDFGNQYQEITQELYMLDGYVWEDENENDEIDETEAFLSGWTVEATDGELVFSTTTDSSGYYKLNVPAGTWTITQTTQSGWSLVFPGAGSHVVTVPDTEVTFLDTIREFIIPTAYAQVQTSFGPFNFGLIENTTTTNRGGGGGGSSSPRCELFEADVDGSDVTLRWETRRGSDISITQNGTEIFSSGDNSVVDAGTFDTIISGAADFELMVSRGSRTRSCTVDVGEVLGAGLGGDFPEGIVMGDQVSVIPAGAPDTGAGGTAPQTPTGLTLLLALPRLRNDAS